MVNVCLRRQFIFNMSKDTTYLQRFVADQLGCPPISIGDCYRVSPLVSVEFPDSMTYEYQSQDWPTTLGNTFGPILARQECGPLGISISWITQSTLDEDHLRSYVSMTSKSFIFPDRQAHTILAVMNNGKIYSQMEYVTNLNSKFAFFSRFQQDSPHSHVKQRRAR